MGRRPMEAVCLPPFTEALKTAVHARFSAGGTKVRVSGRSLHCLPLIAPQKSPVSGQTLTSAKTA